MVHGNLWKGILAFAGMSLVLSSNAQAYNQADLDAAERGLQGRKVMADFLTVYKGDPSQLGNRKDILYISYELIRRIEKGEESLTNQLKAIDLKLNGLAAKVGKTGTVSSPALDAKVDTLNLKLLSLEGRVTRLSPGGTGGQPSADVAKEVKTLLPTLIQQDSKIQMMEKEITALKKDQKTDRKGSDRDINSQVQTARLIAGTSIAVTLFTVLFMAR